MAHRVIRGLRGAVKNVGLQQKSRPIGHVSRMVTRNYMSEMEKSTFEGKILRLIRNEIEYELDRSPPSPPIPEFIAFKVEEKPGEQWIRLTRKFGASEEIKVEVTMFDGSLPIKKVGDDAEDDVQLHITLIVELFKEENKDAMQFVCSAWPDSIEIRKVFTRRLDQIKDHPYIGPRFKELDDELQDSLYAFLEARGIDDDLAAFLHQYITNKDKTEYIRWLEKAGEHVFLRISPFQKVTRFGQKGKLAPRFIGQFEILEKVGDAAYRLTLPPYLSNIHDVFHVSLLRTSTD